MWRNTIKFDEFKKNLEREAPLFANINLLGKCNAKCVFCLGLDIKEQFSKQNQIKTHFNDWANFETFLERCKASSIKRIYVTGQNTDSLIYKHLDELVPYLQGEHGFEVGMRTNGYLAPRKMEVINRCKRNVGYSIHSLDPETNFRIMGRRDIPDWDTIIPNTRNCRVSIVLNRHNEHEFPTLLEYISKFDNVKYIQVRRICTDIREDEFIEDVRVYEKVFAEYTEKYPIEGRFYNAEIFRIHGKEVCFWRTVKTTINSFNYYTDGTINEEYFVIEGYMRDSENYPRTDDVPNRPVGGKW